MIHERSKCLILLILFLCVELLVLCMGGEAFYSNRVEIAVTEGVPSIHLSPILPPAGWQTQQQWFTARGDYLNRIIFYTMENEGEEGGLTVNLRDENGALIAAQYYSSEACSENTLFFEIQKTVKLGGRYCFEVVADPGGSGWAVPYLYVPGGELSAWEDAGVDNEPMAGGLCYLFLSFFFARMHYAAVGFHAAALIAGAVYLFACCFGKRMWGMDAAMLCAACVCALGQFILCKDYYLSKTLLLCLPCVFLAGIAVLQWVRRSRVRVRIRLSLRSWRTAVFLAAALAVWILLPVCIRGTGFSLLGIYFYIACAAYAAFLFLGVFSVRRLDAFCARFPWVVYAVESVLIFLHMETANLNPFKDILFTAAIWNVLTVFILFTVLWALLGNFRLAGEIGVLFFAIWGIANYLTVDFRGIPIMPGDLMSAGTALNVLSNYHVELSLRLTTVFILIALEVLLLFRIPAKAGIPIKTDGKPGIRKYRIFRGAAFFCAVLIFWQGYFGALSPFNLTSWEWDWRVGYYQQGYTATTIAKIQKLFPHPPAGYTPTEVQMLCEAKRNRMDAVQADSGNCPNVLLILNESWFDWRQVTEFETDRPVMPFIDSLENCIRGFAVEPLICGGTSLSEYELLTSNSLSMLPETTPFTQLSLEGSYSVVSYLKSLHYTATALHPYEAGNYNRRIVYPQLGFDRVAFGGDDIWRDAGSLRRYISDDAAFEVLETLFEEKDEGAPVLLYLLTMQNHGGYFFTEKNGGAYPLDDAYEITIEKGFDLCRADAEEYLSLVRYTDAAFEGLIGYFENVDEPTVICMAGDHAPTLGAEIESFYEGYEWNQRQRGTPFVIWANYPIESYDAGYIGMVQLAPLLMKTAGLPLSVYYQTILNLGEEYPALNISFYQDQHGNFESYSYLDEIPQNEEMKQYFYYEYNSLQAPKNRISEIFLAQ